MKISQLLEGYFKNLDIDRQEGRYVAPKPVPKKVATENQKFHIALWFDTSGYLVTTVAPTLKRAESIALYRVKQYLKANYPRYDITGLRKDQVRLEQIPEDQLRIKSRNLIIV